MKALVTGGTGFIGSHLVEALLQRGADVRCLLRKSSDLRWIRGLPVEYAWGDCCDKASLKEAVRGVDLVVHSAGVTKAVNKETFFQVNALGTENLVQACLEGAPGLQRFVYLSSQAAAGPTKCGNRKRETDPCEPVSAYGRSKRMGEELALAQAHRLPLLILRPSAVYGPRDRDIYFFFKCLSKKVNPCLCGPDQHISLCHVDDLVRAVLLASEDRPQRGEIFFVSDGRDYPFEEIGKTFARALGINAFRLPVPRWILSGAASFSEGLARFSRRPALISKGKVEEMAQKNWVCDITKAKSVLGFEPSIPLTRGARLTVDWYRNENWL